jgi:hypothetical protein
MHVQQQDPRAAGSEPHDNKNGQFQFVSSALCASGSRLQSGGSLYLFSTSLCLELLGGPTDQPQKKFAEIFLCLPELCLGYHPLHS